MQNHDLGTTGEPQTRTKQQIALFVTTEQEMSSFTVQTRWSGVQNFGFDLDEDTRIYSRNEVARRGQFTFIALPDGRRKGDNLVADPDIAVQTDGNSNTTAEDRRKGLIITADNPDHELTIYEILFCFCNNTRY